jgi:16S rRNA (guanine527-N7)-methyltransferase
MLGGRLSETPAFAPPFGPSQTVIIVEKAAPTPERFPRRPGIPSKRPL